MSKELDDLKKEYQYLLQLHATATQAVADVKKQADIVGNAISAIKAVASAAVPKVTIATPGDSE